MTTRRPGGVAPRHRRINPSAPAAERLIRLLSEIFAGLGGEAGRELPELLREIGIGSRGSTHM
jgi:hypothetical protein